VRTSRFPASVRPSRSSHRRGGRARRAAVEAEEAADELQVFAARHCRLDRGRLAGETDHLTHTPRLGPGVDARNAQFTAVGTQQGGNHPDERRLARPVRPQQGGDLTRLGDQIQTGKSLDLAEAFGQASSLNDRRHSCSPPHRSRRIRLLTSTTRRDART